MARRGVWAVAGLLAIAIGGCATVEQPPPPPPRASLAEVVIYNPTPYAWRLEFRAPAGSVVKAEAVAPRGTVAVHVPGGVDYVIEQAVTTARAIPPRTTTMRLEAGERYDWELATLLTLADAAEIAREDR